MNETCEECGAEVEINSADGTCDDCYRAECMRHDDAPGE